MTDIRDLGPPVQQDQMLTRLWRGYVADDVASEEDGILVIIPDFDKDFDWGPCKWQPDPGITLPRRLPQQGDEVLVAFDNRMEPWVVVWWPV